MSATRTQSTGQVVQQLAVLLALLSWTPALTLIIIDLIARIT